MAWIITGLGGISRKFINSLNKRLPILSFLLIFTFNVSAQVYLRGEVKDENNNPVSNARIVLHLTGYVYYSGSTGGFGIITEHRSDSITVSASGYHPVSIRVNSAEFQRITLKLLSDKISVQRNRLLSFTRNLQLSDRTRPHNSGESYSTLIENEFVDTRKYPETGFAIRIDKASYSNIRRFLNMDTRVPSDAVRIEELLNYFNFDYTAPPGDSVFALTSQVSDCPWNPATQLLFLKVCAKKIPPERIPPSNLVFLIDVSGSMDMPNRLPLLKSAFKLLVDNLRDTDTISIVVYGSAVGVWLQPTSGKEKTKIRKAIEELSPAGATPGQSGILSAYSLAKNQFIEGGNNRVILATDGDFNVGVSSEEQLEKLITSHKESGIYLTCLGVGMGNYKDSKLEVLAKKGNGNFSYLDNEAEAEKVLVKELTQTLYSVADNATLTIKFDDRYIKEYRLIGYDNKLKVLSDSVSILEGGEVGSGHSMMVVFEIKPTTTISAAFQFSNLFPVMNKSIAGVGISYKLPADTTTFYSSFPVTYNYQEYNEVLPCYRFAASVVMFGSLLKESPYAKHMTWNEAIIAANDSYDPYDPVQQEFIKIISKAKKIYAKGRRKRSSRY